MKKFFLLNRNKNQGNRIADMDISFDKKPKSKSINTFNSVSSANDMISHRRRTKTGVIVRNRKKNPIEISQFNKSVENRQKLADTSRNVEQLSEIEISIPSIKIHMKKPQKQILTNRTKQFRGKIYRYKTQITQDDQGLNGNYKRYDTQQKVKLKQQDKEKNQDQDNDKEADKKTMLLKGIRNKYMHNNSNTTNLQKVSYNSQLQQQNAYKSHKQNQLLMSYYFSNGSKSYRNQHRRTKTVENIFFPSSIKKQLKTNEHQTVVKRFNHQQVMNNQSLLPFQSMQNNQVAVDHEEDNKINETQNIKNQVLKDIQTRRQQKFGVDKQQHEKEQKENENENENEKDKENKCFRNSLLIKKNQTQLKTDDDYEFIQGLQQLRFQNGWKYEGGVVNNTFDKWGMLISQKGKLIYKGDFQMGYFDGYGEIENHYIFSYLVNLAQLKRYIEESIILRYQEDSLSLNFDSMRTQKSQRSCKIKQINWKKYSGQFKKGEINGFGELAIKITTNSQQQNQPNSIFLLLKGKFNNGCINKGLLTMTSEFL